MTGNYRKGRKVSEDVNIRLAKVEQRVDLLIEAFEKRDEKIDQLLELKNKGLGAFWLVTLIFGSSLIAGVASLVNWIKG